MKTLLNLTLIAVAAFLGGFVAESLGRDVTAQQVPAPKAADAAESSRVKQLIVVDAENKPVMTVDGSKGTLVLHGSAGKDQDLILGRLFDDGVGLACGVNGKIRAFFAASATTSGFMIADAKENILMEGHVSADGKANSIMFSDPEVRGRAIFGTDDSGNGRVQFFGRDRKERAVLRQAGKGGVELAFNDAKGNKRVAMAELEGLGAEVTVYDEKKVARGALFITEETGPRLTIFDAAGKPTSNFPASKDSREAKD